MRRRSLTLSKKPDEEPQNKQESHLEPSAQLYVTIYLRKANKATKITHAKKRIRLSEIFDLVQKETQVPRSSQMLFYQGKNLSVDSACPEEEIQFEEKSILHIHSLNKNPSQPIRIKLQYLSAECVKYRELLCVIVPEESLGKCLEMVMKESDENLKEYTFIQSGRKLDIEKKSRELYIEDGSVIMVIDKKREEIRKIVEIVEEEREMMAKMEAESEKLESKKQPAYEQYSPSFKKKNKIMCLSKASNFAKNREIQWESDSSSEFNKRELLKNLYKKKNSSARTIHLIQHDNFSTTNSHQNKGLNFVDKLQLKQQIKKLFQSDSLHNQAEVKKLQPPKFTIHDNFIEETEEIDMVVDQHSDSSDSSGSSGSSGTDEGKGQQHKNEKKGIENMRSLYSSLPLDLRKSIGGTRGVFTPVPLIPTRDFDEQDNDEQDNDENDD